jgi:hypothetical protein
MMTILTAIVCCRTRTFFAGGLVAAGLVLSLGRSEADPRCMMGCENGTAPFAADANNVCGPGVSVAYFCPTSTGGRKLCHCPPADTTEDPVTEEEDPVTEEEVTTPTDVRPNADP